MKSPVLLLFIMAAVSIYGGCKLSSGVKYVQSQANPVPDESVTIWEFVNDPPFKFQQVEITGCRFAPREDEEEMSGGLRRIMTRVFPSQNYPGQVEAAEGVAVLMIVHDDEALAALRLSSSVIGMHLTREFLDIDGEQELLDVMLNSISDPNQEPMLIVHAGAPSMLSNESVQKGGLMLICGLVAFGVLVFAWVRGPDDGIGEPEANV